MFEYYLHVHAQCTCTHFTHQHDLYKHVHLGQTWSRNSFMVSSFQMAWASSSDILRGLYCTAALQGFCQSVCELASVWSTTACVLHIHVHVHVHHVQCMGCGIYMYIYMLPIYMYMSSHTNTHTHTHLDTHVIFKPLQFKIRVFLWSNLSVGLRVNWCCIVRELTRSTKVTPLSGDLKT